MGRLGEVKARRALRALLRLGFTAEHRDGSHRFLAHPDGRTMVFAFHDSETIGPKILAKILKDVQIGRDEFRSAL